ncbi:class I SAM-dependent methyltransferase [Granulicatella seriolae]|uniref:Methyltransferase domain-containing protein n=1 Tax=Granulicatella seriolae TaxID=2967226 RepID=A0ABT1WQL7_9LACT|nr:class I SAM-dependent methyltransferase [Granulicatella seriolae]
MSVDLERYREFLKEPWGRIQYEVTFARLEHIENKQILDFGSGLGLTSEFLSRKNDVIAMEPNAEMLDVETKTAYRKILGSLEQLEKLEADSFDVVLCHNVLEYIEPSQRVHYMKQFQRVLKPEGELSIIKHNHVGKVIQMVVFENDLTKALQLLGGENFESVSFRQGEMYTIEELLGLSHMTLEKYQGIRTFYALQPNAFKTGDRWLEEMTRMELAVCDLKPYKDISFFQHVWLKNNK